jgi:hypothetical protein
MIDFRVNQDVNTICHLSKLLCIIAFKELGDTLLLMKFRKLSVSAILLAEF